MEELSRRSDANSELRAGMKLALGYMLKTTAKVMRGKYLIEDKDDKAHDVDNFTIVLNLEWGDLFRVTTSISVHSPAVQVYFPVVLFYPTQYMSCV